MSLEFLDARVLGTRARLARTVLRHVATVAKEGDVRPVIVSPDLARRFLDCVGCSAETFSLTTRIFELEAKDGDDVLVRDVESALPLIFSRKGHIVVNFDIAATRAFRFADSKRPVYTYVPGFDIHKVPEWFRRPVSNVVQALRSGKLDVVARYGALPLTGFECAALLIAIAASDANRLPFTWPSGHRAVFLSFHDVDTAGLLARKDLDPLLCVEQKHGIRSCWFVPTTVLGRDEHAVDFLRQAGHEVGWRGHKHDHREHVGRHADAAVNALTHSQLVDAANFPLGMRLPRLLKSHYLFAQLEPPRTMLQYDTSFLNGVVPYPLWLNGGPSKILEIPTTVPTDILLYNQLHQLPPRQRGDVMLQVQIARTERLRAIGAVISIVTHPEKGISERPDFLNVYDQYLAYIRSATDIWFPTAGEFFSYWTGLQAPVAQPASSDVLQAEAMAQ